MHILVQLRKVSRRELIEVYRSLPALWNVKGKEYSNRDLKNEQNEILLRKYKEKYPEATKKEVAAKVNALRTNYRRELKRISALEKSGSGFSDENEPTLYYFEAMDFLRDNEIPCPSRSSFLNENISEIQIPKKRKKADPSDELIALAAKRLSEPRDEFRAIAETWASKLRKLEHVQRMFAEKFVNDILFEAQMGALHRNWLRPNIESRASPSTPVTNSIFFQNSEEEQSSFKQMQNPSSSYNPLSAQDGSFSSVSGQSYILKSPSSAHLEDLSCQSSSARSQVISAEDTYEEIEISEQYISNAGQYFASFK